MKKRKTYLYLSLVMGLVAIVFWTLRFFHPEIGILIPLTFNTFQFAFLGLIKS